MVEKTIIRPLTVTCPRIEAPVADGEIGREEWAGAARLDDFRRPDGRPAQSRTVVLLGHDGGYLHVAITCAERNTGRLGREESVILNFDPGHDHCRLYQFIFHPFDAHEELEGTVGIGYREGPDARWIHANMTRRAYNFCRFSTRVEPGRHWALEASIPWEALGAGPPGPGTAWGFNFVRRTAWPAYRGECSRGEYADPVYRPSETTALSFLPDLPWYHPAVFADLVFGAEAVRLETLDPGLPHFGFNRSPVSFSVPDPGEDLVVSTRVRSVKNGKIIDPAREVTLVPDGPGRVSGALEWKASHYDDSNRLEIEARRVSDGRREWSGSYDFGWEGGSLPIYYRHLGECPPGTPDPDPGDPDFLVRKSEFIAARQPRFRRVNTSGGAPSDFCLESEDGKILFNLMEPGVLEKMARFVHGLYENDADRLSGASFLLGQPAFMRANPAYDPAGAQRLDSLSKLRFGSGYCGHMARILAPLVNRLEVGETGRFHRARQATIGGHVIVLVEYRGDFALLDSKHCCLFYRLDNTDLATLSEIRREPEIARRSYPHFMPALMTFDEGRFSAAEPDGPTEGGLAWPAGAPGL